MGAAFVFFRIFFVVVSIACMTVRYVYHFGGVSSTSLAVGAACGVGCAALLAFFDFIFKHFSLRSLNVCLIGLFVGYLMGQTLVFVFNAILDLGSMAHRVSPYVTEMVEIFLLLAGTYLGATITLRSSSELYASIPFVKFSVERRGKGDLIVDASALSDKKLFDLCATGIFDQRLLIPHFVIRDIHAQTKSQSDYTKSRACMALEVLQKLEQIKGIGLQFSDTEFPAISRVRDKIFKMADLVGADVLVANHCETTPAWVKGVNVISMQDISNALRPLMSVGECIKIKVQRSGKEPQQGVGYLEDGSMVVVNGGGQHIGRVVDVGVISVKQTMSGRMVFCNLLEV